MRWLTRARVVAYGTMVALGWLALGLGLFAQAHLDPTGTGAPMVTDFNTFYAVSMLIRAAPPAQAYDGTVMLAFEHLAAQAAYGGGLAAAQVQAIPLFPWLYPPTVLPLVAPLALAPYLVAYALWDAASLGLFVAALRRATTDRPVALAVGLAFPGTFQCLMYGQNGLLTAALLGLGLAQLRPRPVLAGMCFGLMAFKPHLAVLVPVALVAGGHWRAVASAAVTLAATVAATVLAFGTAPWAAFLANAATASRIVETGYVPWTLMPTPFALVRLGGGGVATAYALQAATAAAAVGAVVWAWRRDGPPALKASVLVLATVLANPFEYVYDLVVLVLPLLWLGHDMIARPAPRWQWATVAAGFVMPLAAPAVAKVVALQPGCLVLAALLAVSVLRLRRGGHISAPPPKPPRPTGRPSAL